MAGVRAVGGGKTCHQCRHKTNDFMASCKNLKKPNSRCPILYCHKCLYKRYGEKAEEVELLGDWRCPKCRGNCNCSCYRKEQGLAPMGLVVHVAKGGEFGSVLEVLTVNRKENVGVETKVVDKEVVDGNENCVGVNVEVGWNSVQNPKEGEMKKTKRNGLKEICNGTRVGPEVNKDGYVRKVKSRKRKHKDRSEQPDDGKLQGEGGQEFVPASDARRKKKKLKNGIETFRVEECIKDQREEADDLL